MRQLLAVSCLLFVAGCSRQGFTGVESIGDTTRVAAGVRIEKLKAKTVILQTGSGNVATPTDNTKAGQKEGAAATAPQAQASTTAKKAAPTWWLYLIAALAGAGVVEYASHRGLLNWLPWRVKPG